MSRVMLFFIVFAAVFAGLCFLQVRLSGKPRWTTGLILPCAHLLLTALVMCVFVIYSMVGIPTTGGSAVLENGNVIITVYDNGVVKAEYADTGKIVTGIYSSYYGLYDNETGELIASTQDIYDIVSNLSAADIDASNDKVVSIVNVLGEFVLLNIPTVVYLIIYFVVRQGRRSVDQLDKIEIQDL